MLKSSSTFSRRAFISRLAAMSAMSISVIAAFSGCDKKNQKVETADTAAEPVDCRDLSAVSKEDIAIREKLAYVNESPMPDNQCANCNLYLPPSGGKKCGGCMLFKGPVEAKGYCTYWAPKV
jgi:hypothetical protein